MTTKQRVSFSFTMKPEMIELGQKALQKRSAKTILDQHKINVSILHNWADNGAVNVAAQRAAMVIANCDPYYAQAIVNWYAVHAGFEWDAKEKSFTYTKTKLSAEEWQAAKGEDFKTLTPPSTPKAFNLDEKIKTLITAAENRMKAKAEKRHEDDDISMDHLQMLKAIVK